MIPVGSSISDILERIIIIRSEVPSFDHMSVICNLMKRRVVKVKWSEFN
jgi:hypothetical protein